MYCYLLIEKIGLLEVYLNRIFKKMYFSCRGKPEAVYPV